MLALSRARESAYKPEKTLRHIVGCRFRRKNEKWSRHFDVFIAFVGYFLANYEQYTWALDSCSLAAEKSMSVIYVISSLFLPVKASHDYTGTKKPDERPAFSSNKRFRRKKRRFHAV